MEKRWHQGGASHLQWGRPKEEEEAREEELTTGQSGEKIHGRTEWRRLLNGAEVASGLWWLQGKRFGDLGHDPRSPDYVHANGVTTG